MDALDPKIISFVVGILIANVGVIIGGYVSMKVQLAKLEVLVDKLQADLNNIGAIMRDCRNKLGGGGE